MISFHIYHFWLTLLFACLPELLHPTCLCSSCWMLRLLPHHLQHTCRFWCSLVNPNQAACCWALSRGPTRGYRLLLEDTTNLVVTTMAPSWRNWSPPQRWEGYKYNTNLETSESQRIKRKQQSAATTCKNHPLLGDNPVYASPFHLLSLLFAPNRGRRIHNPENPWNLFDLASYSKQCVFP